MSNQVGKNYVAQTLEHPVCQLFIEGVTAGYFLEFHDLGVEYEVLSHKIVGPTGQEISEKSPGRRKIKKVILKRQISVNLDIWDWRKTVEDGDVASARANATIQALNTDYSVLATWNLTNAWPLSVVSERDVNGVNYEVVTIVCEELVRVS
jgi:phage tail-like protein